MKTAIGFMLVMVLALSVAPAVAGDPFHALRTLPTTEQATLTPLSDTQLATVEGGDSLNLDLAIQVTIIGPQINICVFCENVVQVNNAVSVQGISQ